MNHVGIGVGKEGREGGREGRRREGGECIRMNHGTLSTDRVSLCYSIAASL